MTTSVGSHRLPSDSVIPDPRRWWALSAVATAQLLIGLDGTIMNIALPSVQKSLDMSDPARQWVITIFALGTAACYSWPTGWPGPAGPMSCPAL
ncbi:hypothetical protein [Nonomuraea sp. NPDC049784]|uniref:hypothetical protein n=1 Tax=Nonomuraea sp. NPDC049784 TaxID=3154361 RepID=UPI0033CE9485